MQFLAHQPNTPWRPALATKLDTCGIAVSMSASYFSSTLSVSLTRLMIEFARLQQHQHARPVDGLADRGQLLQVQRADLVDEADDLLAQRRGDARHAALDDALFQLLLGKADMQMQAAPLQRVAERSRSPLEVRITVGLTIAETVPSSGIVTW